MLNYRFFDREGDGDEDIAFYYHIGTYAPRQSSTTYQGTILNVQGHLSNLYPAPFLSNTDSNTIHESPTSFDIDQDGDLDSILGISNHVFWVEMQDGVEVAQHVITDDWSYMPLPSFADLDGDGDWDAWFRYKSYGSPRVCINMDGLGHVFERRSLPGSYYRVVIEICDINGDGYSDFLYYIRGGLSFITNDTHNIYWPYQCDAISASSRPGQVLDLDGDGDLDFTIRGSVAWFENLDGNGHFSCPNIVNTNQAEAVVFEDYNGDGDRDVVLSLPEQGGVYWHEQLGSGPLFGPAELLTSSAYVDVAVTDLNNDGLMDIVGISQDKSQIQYHVQLPGGSLSAGYPVAFTNDLGGFQLQAIFAPRSNTTTLNGQPVAFAVDATDDLFESGRGVKVQQICYIFLLKTNEASPSMDNLIDGPPHQWPSDGAKSVGYFDRGVPIGVPHVSRFVDLDGDGADDLLFGLGGGDTMRALLGDSENIEPLGPGYSCLGANETVDLDNDGDLDLVITKSTSKPHPAGGDYLLPVVRVAENLDGVSFASGMIAEYPTPEPTRGDPFIPGQGSLSGDFDGDGDVDIITLPGLDLFRNVSALPHVNDWTLWLQKYGVPHGETDGDSDGATAEQEYAFGGHPWFSTSSPPGMAILKDTNGVLQLTVQQRRSTNLTYFLQSSSNLVQWLDILGSNPSLENIDDEWDRAIYSSSNNIQDCLPQFFRMRSSLLQ